MDEMLQDLENELKRLPARKPSARLLAALHHDLDGAAASLPSQKYRTATTLRSWKWMGWSTAAAALILMAALLVRNHVTPAPQSAPEPSLAATAPSSPSRTPSAAVNRYEPVAATSVLYDLSEDGIATLPDRSEGRQLRYRYVDTYTWKNPATNASVRWSVPRDEVRIIRASLD